MEFRKVYLASSLFGGYGSDKMNSQVPLDWTSALLARAWPKLEVQRVQCKAEKVCGAETELVRPERADPAPSATNVAHWKKGGEWVLSYY